MDLCTTHLWETRSVAGRTFNRISVGGTGRRRSSTCFRWFLGFAASHLPEPTPLRESVSRALPDAHRCASVFASASNFGHYFRVSGTLGGSLFFLLDCFKFRTAVNTQLLFGPCCWVVLSRSCHFDGVAFPLSFLEVLPSPHFGGAVSLVLLRVVLLSLICLCFFPVSLRVVLSSPLTIWWCCLFLFFGFLLSSFVFWWRSGNQSSLNNSCFSVCTEN